MTDRWSAPLVRQEISTRHPEDYILVNTEDGTAWQLQRDASWKRVQLPGDLLAQLRSLLE